MPITKKTKRKQTVEKLRLSETIYNHVVDSIRAGKYKAGRRITEKELCDELRVSKIPVREAMERLEDHSWVVRLSRGRGFFIKDFSLGELEETYIIREILETGAVRVLTEKISEEQLDELQEIVKVLDAAWKKGDAETYKEADSEFHRLLVRFTGSERLSRLFETVILQAGCFYFIGALDTEFYANKAEESLKPVSHDKILKAVAEHEIEKAEKLIRQHIKSTLKMITELKQLSKLL